MRILTHNTHIPYIYLLSKIPGIELIVFSLRYKNRDWQNCYREKPKNVLHLAIDESDLFYNYLQIVNYDKIIINDFEFLQYLCDPKNPLFNQLQKIPKIFVFHNSLYVEYLNMPPEVINQQVAQIRQLFAIGNVKPVFISRWKAESWQIPGTIILPGIDLEDFPKCWIGKNNNFKLGEKYLNYSLRVCSNFEHRDFMNGYKVSNTILSAIKQPAVILGENPQPKENMPFNIWQISQNFNHYKTLLSQARFLLSCNNPNFEDFYNLSSLEAIAMGCPVIFTEHIRQTQYENFAKTFPITSNNIEFLQKECQKLFDNFDYAKHISEGQAGFVEKNFSLSSFIMNWKSILEAK